LTVGCSRSSISFAFYPTKTNTPKAIPRENSRWDGLFKKKEKSKTLVPGYLRGNEKQKQSHQKRVVFAALLTAVLGKVADYIHKWWPNLSTLVAFHLLVTKKKKKEKKKEKKSFASRSQTTSLSTRSLYTLFGFSFSFFLSTWGGFKKAIRSCLERKERTHQPGN
jgi:hypothetical protein